MEIDRKTWSEIFPKSEFPPWLCPGCSRGTLIIDPKSFIQGETAESILRDDLSEESFACQMKCTYPPCKGNVVVCGDTFPMIIDDLEEGNLPIKVCRPTYINPTPHIFHIPSKCPENISCEVKKAFSLYWCDTSAAGNRVRASIELLMDHLRIKKRSKTKKGTYRPISLHDRILDYHPKNPEIGELLLAIKWLGNTGSHGSDLKKKDLMDDFEMLQFVFEDIFELKRRRLKVMAQGINRRKGPKRNK